jgi:hypothetical protein
MTVRACRRLAGELKAGQLSSRHEKQASHNLVISLIINLPPPDLCFIDKRQNEGATPIAGERAGKHTSKTNIGARGGSGDLAQGA